MTRSNIVTGELFSEKFSETLNRYINGLLTNEEVIQDLLKLAKEMMEAEQQGNDLGLSNEEKAFYDALTRPQAVKDFYTNEQLVALTKDLTDMLRKNRTIDWNRREAERANMRRLVKRLLRKYKYPPEEAEGAMNTVLKQCEQWAENQEYQEIRKIFNIEDDRDVRNLIYNRLQLNPDTSDGDLQVEVMKEFAERYPDMKIMDWMRIVSDYTPLVREAAKRPTAQVMEMQQRQHDMAAEPTEDNR